MVTTSLRQRARAALVLGAFLLAPRALAAQVPAASRLGVDGAFAYEGYGFAAPDVTGIHGLTLATSSFNLRASLPADLRLRVSGAYAEGTLTHPDGTATTLAGLTDTEVRVELPLAEEAVVLTALAQLPTGSATQSVAEAEVAGAIAADLLPFRISNWGTGGAFGLAAAVARTIGGFGVGVSAGYSFARQFEPLAEDRLAYRPGNELRLRAAVDRSFGRAAHASLQVTAERYADDVLDGQNLYRSGNRLSVVGSLGFAAGWRATGLAYAGVLHRSAGTYLLETRSTAAQDLVVGGVDFRIPVGGIRLLPGVDGRAIRTGDGVGQGYLAGIGAALEVPGQDATVVPSLRARLGHLQVRPGTNGRFQGIEAALAVHFGGRH